jgi:hydrogenase maturation protein HypF
MTLPPPTIEIVHRRLALRGVVQGVGLRPRIARLARQCGVTGSVRNEGSQVVVEAHATPPALAAFTSLLQTSGEGPARVDVVALLHETTSASPPTGFQIEASESGRPMLGVAPDLAVCPACVAETLDPFSRRYRYAFTACTQCGPRLSVFRGVPYDRRNTSMEPFGLCAQCLVEYGAEGDRRYHAQAMACYACGPRATLKRLDGQPFALDALSFLDDCDAACSLIGKGQVVLVKGIGGYQLACDATRDDAVARLRGLKRRDRKPFALLMRDLDMVHAWCDAEPAAIEALSGPAAPIVLLARRAQPASAQARLAEGIAPGLATIGVMLPSTPLHHLMMRRRRAPIVLTSGNISHEPQAIRLDEAAAKLGSHVSYVLDHNRQIERRVDDSVARVIDGTPCVMRRSRGYAPSPRPVPQGFATDTQVLALGGDLKNTFALLRDGQIVMSQHMGDLHDSACLEDQSRALNDYLAFYDFEPDVVACDRHPDYASTRQAEARWPLKARAVGHHHAHIAACIGEHGRALNSPPVLGIALDGIGLGEDGRLWGGEFLRADYTQVERLGTFKPVALPGGDLAAREPWRNTYAHLMAEMGWTRFAMNFAELELFAFLRDKPRALLDSVLADSEISPLASSTGRLFDAVAAAVGVCRERSAYEGEAAMCLEALIGADDLDEHSELDYPFAIPRLDKGKGLPYVEPLAMWQALLGDLILHTPASRIAARFHRGLGRAIVRMALQLCEAHGLRTVALGGGVFQNKVLTEAVLRGLREAGLEALMPREIPSGDGGLAFGQALVALARHSVETRA